MVNLHDIPKESPRRVTYNWTIPNTPIINWESNFTFDWPEYSRQISNAYVRFNDTVTTTTNNTRDFYRILIDGSL